MNFSSLGRVLSKRELVLLRQQLLELLSDHFIPALPESMPIACRIQPTTQADHLNEEWFAGFDSIVLYFENYEVMVQSDPLTALRFLDAREPWEDFDVCLFDNDFSLCAALTHNDQAKFVRLRDDR